MSKYNAIYTIIKQVVKITVLSSLLFSSLFLVLSSPAYASSQQILRVFPIILNVPLSPDKTYSYDITLENVMDTSLPLQANLSDFQTTGEEGGYAFEDTKTNPLLSWITLSDTNLILTPKEKRTVHLTITTPKSIPLGGYYGMLFFQPVPQNLDPTATKVVSKIGVLMLADIGVQDPKAKKAEILDFSTGFLHENPTIPILLRVKNVSLHFFTAKPIVTIAPVFPVFGHDQKLILEDKIIFQGKVRRWNEEITLSNNQPNLYRLHMAVSTGNGQYVTQDNYIILFPFTKSIIIIVLFVLTLFVIKKRKRLKKAIKELYR